MGSSWNNRLGFDGLLLILSFFALRSWSLPGAWAAAVCTARPREMVGASARFGGCADLC